MNIGLIDICYPRTALSSVNQLSQYAYVFYRHGIFLFMRIICGPDETHFIASGTFCIMQRQNVTIFSVSCCHIPVCMRRDT